MLSECTKLFKALSDQTRQEILRLLEERDMNVTEMCGMLRSMTQPTVSHHLQILKSCNLVDYRKKGKLIYYYINKKVMKNAIQEFIEEFEMEIREL